MRTIAIILTQILVFTVPWEAVVEHPTLGTVSRLIGAVAAGAWLLSVVMRRRVRTPTVFHLAMVSFVVWNATTIFWSRNAGRSVEHLVTWAQLVVMTFMFWDIYTTRRSIEVALQMFVLGGYVIVGNTLWSYMSGASYYYERFSAAGTNPDDLGVILALAMPPALYLGISRRTHGWSYLLRAVNCLFVPAGFFGIALSATRSAMIAALPAVLFGLALLWRLKLGARLGLATATVIAALALVPLVPATSLGRLGSTGSELRSGNLNGRVGLWRQGVASFLQRPWQGVGSNMYRSVNLEHKVAHNTFVSVLAELGLIGLALYLVVLGIAVLEALRQPPWERALWCAMLGAWFVGAMSLTWEYRKPTWVLLGLVIASAPVLRGQPRLAERWFAAGAALDPPVVVSGGPIPSET